MSKKSIAIAIGIAYSLALLIGAGYLSGGGHIFLFVLLSASPLGAGIIFWPIIAGWLSNIKVAIDSLRLPSSPFTTLV